MSTEIEEQESRIANLRRELEREESRLERMMTDSRPPENIYGIKTMEDVMFILCRGKWLANYTKGRISVFEPGGGGCYGHIYGELADELGQRYDHHNYLYHHRTEDAK